MPIIPVFLRKTFLRGSESIENTCIYFLPQGQKHARLTCAKLYIFILLNTLPWLKSAAGFFFFLWPVVF